MLHLGDPSGRCRAIEVLAYGDSLVEVLQRLRATGLEGIRRPKPGTRPNDDEVAVLAAAAPVDFLWREWPDRSDWLPRQRCSSPELM
jgi:hypothetical protein